MQKLAGCFFGLRRRPYRRNRDGDGRSVGRDSGAVERGRRHRCTAAAPSVAMRGLDKAVASEEHRYVHIWMYPALSDAPRSVRDKADWASPPILWVFPAVATRSALVSRDRVSAWRRMVFNKELRRAAFCGKSVPIFSSNAD